MTLNDLIAALQDECRADRVTIEDFLRALSDLCVESLERGEPFHIGDVGSIAVNPSFSRTGKGIRSALFFKASENLRKRLRIPEDALKPSAPETCRGCGIRPNKVQIYDGCLACIRSRSTTGALLK
jgi:hypothetical protein